MNHNPQEPSASGSDHEVRFSKADVDLHVSAIILNHRREVAELTNKNTAMVLHFQRQIADLQNENTAFKNSLESIRRMLPAQPMAQAHTEYSVNWPIAPVPVFPGGSHGHHMQPTHTQTPPEQPTKKRKLQNTQNAPQHKPADDISGPPASAPRSRNRTAAGLPAHDEVMASHNASATFQPTFTEPRHSIGDTTATNHATLVAASSSNQPDPQFARNILGYARKTMTWTKMLRTRRTLITTDGLKIPNRAWLFAYRFLNTKELGVYFFECPRKGCVAFTSHPLAEQRGYQHLRDCGELVHNELEMIQKYAVQVIDNSSNGAFNCSAFRNWNNTVLEDTKMLGRAHENFPQAPAQAIDSAILASVTPDMARFDGQGPAPGAGAPNTQGHTHGIGQSLSYAHNPVPADGQGLPDAQGPTHDFGQGLSHTHSSVPTNGQGLPDAQGPLPAPSAGAEYADNPAHTNRSPHTDEPSSHAYDPSHTTTPVPAHGEGADETQDSSPAFYDETAGIRAFAAALGVDDPNKGYADEYWDGTAWVYDPSHAAGPAPDPNSRYSGLTGEA